ncbi:MAG: tetratricopeptide repeat protein [Syntrophales bacterium]
MRKPVLLLSLLAAFGGLFCMALFPMTAFGESAATIQEGIKQYQAQNFEEAVELFQKARTEAPQSSEAAFWLGISYKQQNNYQDSLPHLRDAVILTPHVREAVVELIDVLYRLDKLKDALQWIAIAEREKIFPGKIAFLKGMVLAKDGKYSESIESFETAKELDKSYSQAADFQIGLSYMLDRKYQQAADRFRVTVTQDPVTDLAAFARRYQDLVEERNWIERPVRLTLSLLGQYDTNMLQEPYIYHGLGEGGEQQSFAMLNMLRVDVIPTLPGRWLFNASGAFSHSVHERHSDSHDLLASTLSIAPGYSFGSFAVNLSANYTFIMKRNPSYARYSSNFSGGPLVRFLPTEEQDQILELYAGYLKKDYYVLPLDPNEDPRASGLDSYISWVRLFNNGAIVNLKYGFVVENTDGTNAQNRGHRFTVNGIIPLRRQFKLQLGAEAFLQDYENANTIPVFDGAKRRDRIYTGIAGLTWDVHKYVSLMLQYTGTRACSNIFVYDYNRSVYSVGAEFRF